MTHTIRKATLADADSLFSLLEQFATSFKPERQQFEANLAAMLDEPSAWLYVAVEDGEVVGYCLGFDHLTFYANGRVSWVEEIMIREDYRGQGVGRMLMATFEDWARSRGSRLVALATRRAAPFYLALGYEESASYFRKLI